MADDLAETNIDSQTDAIMSALGVGDEDEGQGDFAADTPSAVGDESEGDAAPEETPASGEDPQQAAVAAEPGESPAIELPETIPSELRARLKDLPADLQRDLAQWESERNKGVSTKLREAAATQAQLQPERQRLAQQLDAAISLTQNFDPVLAKGLRMTPADWAKLSQEDATGYVQQKADFEARLNNLQQAVAQRNEMQAASHQEVVQREHKALTEAIPELADPAKAKAFATDFHSTMASYGFQENEIQGVVDHRMIKVARDAMLYRAGEAARKAAAAKAVAPSVPRVVRPGAGNASPANAKSAAILKRAASGNLHDQADALAALVERG